MKSLKIYWHSKRDLGRPEQGQLLWETGEGEALLGDSIYAKLFTMFYVKKAYNFRMFQPLEAIR